MMEVNIVVGLLWGILFYFFALCVSLGVYRFYSPWYKTTFIMILISFFGHFAGTYFYALLPSDSIDVYFPLASPEFTGLGVPFVTNMVWYVREWLTEDSYLGILYFFSAFAFLGSVFWYLLFLQISKILKIENQKDYLPALIILCWPSFLFFTAGIKDAVVYFVIPLMLLLINKIYYRPQKSLSTTLFILPFFILMVMIRPYLLMIFAAAYFLVLFSTLKKLSPLTIITLIALLPIMLYIIQWVIETQAELGNTISLESIASRAFQQQKLLNNGTSFPILISTPDPLTMILLLPYGFIMNLIMPLFIFAQNWTGVAASFENIFLIYLFYNFWKKRNFFKFLKKQCSIIKYLFYFFIVGIMFFALINTNLGLAMREKSMFIPAFFVTAMLVRVYSKQRMYDNADYQQVKNEPFVINSCV